MSRVLPGVQRDGRPSQGKQRVGGPWVVSNGKDAQVKKLLVAAAIASVALLVVSCGGGEAPRKTSLETEMENVSYAYGMDVAAVMKRSPVTLDIDLFTQGFRDAYSEGGDLLLTEAEKMQVLQDFMQQVREVQMEEAQAMSDENIAAGKAFLDENKTKEGIKTTASGLQYEVIEEGDGPRPSAENTVRVHYTGTLLDGTKFDSSLDRGQPAEFQLNQVIPGWTEALQLMRVGSKYRIYVPSNLAYGERGAPPMIGPYATLIFDIELLEIVD